MPAGKFKFDYATAVNITLTATSATAVLPASPGSGNNLFGISVNAVARFRISPAGQAVAVATDPLITPNSEIIVIRADGSETNISAILDLSVTPAANQFLSCFRVYEA